MDHGPWSEAYSFISGEWRGWNGRPAAGLATQGRLTANEPVDKPIHPIKCATLYRSVELHTFSHMKPPKVRLLDLTHRKGILTARDVAAAGIHSQHLTRLLDDGMIERIARGRYWLVDRDRTEHDGLVAAAAAVPRGVICLLSALQFHGIGTQLPADVWVAVERGARPPAHSQLPLAVVRVSGAAFSQGIETHRLERRTVRVYSVSKTLADLFKFRNRVGLDTALEALREAWRTRRFTMAELDRAARACRVERVMRPYVEAIVS